MAFKKLKVKVGQVTGTHTNFPTLIQPSLITGLGSITLAEAQSARFYSDVGKTTEIAREIVSADEIHVKVTSMEALAEIWMDYDGIRSDYAVTATYGRNAVWGDYRLVSHFENNADDSTGNLSDTTSSVSYSTGKIGKSIYFNNSSETSGSAEVRYGQALTGGSWSATISTWINNDDSTWQALFLAQDGDQRDWFLNSISGAVGFTLHASGGRFNLRSGTAVLGYDTWGKVDVTVNNSTKNIYVYFNGSQILSGTFSGNTTSSQSVTTLGDWNHGFYQNKLKGYLDETQIKASVNSADWITTEYNNQNANGSFWEATDAGGGGSTPAQVARRGAVMMM